MSESNPFGWGSKSIGGMQRQRVGRFVAVTFMTQSASNAEPAAGRRSQDGRQQKESHLSGVYLDSCHRYADARGAVTRCSREGSPI